MQGGKGIVSVEAHRVFAQTDPLKSTKSPVSSDSALEWLLRGLAPVGSACFTEMHHYTPWMFIERPLGGWHYNYLFLSLCISSFDLCLFFQKRLCYCQGFQISFIFHWFFRVRRGSWVNALCIQSSKITGEDFKSSGLDDLPLQVNLFTSLDLQQVGRGGVLEQWQITQLLSLQIQNNE